MGEVVRLHAWWGTPRALKKWLGVTLKLFGEGVTVLEMFPEVQIDYFGTLSLLYNAWVPFSP